MARILDLYCALLKFVIVLCLAVMVVLVFVPFAVGAAMSGAVARLPFDSSGFAPRMTR